MQRAEHITVDVIHESTSSHETAVKTSTINPSGFLRRREKPEAAF
jgi:hypothetical protein